MLRQGKQVISCAREYDIIDPNFERVKGSIQILMKNIGKSPGIVQESDMKKIDQGRNLLTTVGKHKKKVKVMNPMKLPKNYMQSSENHQYLAQIQNDPIKKIQERIRRHKMTFLEGGLAKENNMMEGGMNNDFELREKLIKEIHFFRKEFFFFFLL